jgi:hypothetical protein
MKGEGLTDTKSIQEIGWLKLDNAAKLFPAIMSGRIYFSLQDNCISLKNQ